MTPSNLKAVKYFVSYHQCCLSVLPYDFKNLADFHFSASFASQSNKKSVTYVLKLLGQLYVKNGATDSLWCLCRPVAWFQAMVYSQVLITFFAKYVIPLPAVSSLLWSLTAAVQHFSSMILYRCYTHSASTTFSTTKHALSFKKLASVTLLVPEIDLIDFHAGNLHLGSSSLSPLQSCCS